MAPSFSPSAAGDSSQFSSKMIDWCGSVSKLMGWLEVSLKIIEWQTVWKMMAGKNLCQR